MDISMLINYYKFRDLSYPIFRKFHDEITTDDILYLTLIHPTLEDLVVSEIINNNACVSKVVLKFLREATNDFIVLTLIKGIANRIVNDNIAVPPNKFRSVETSEVLSELTMFSLFDTLYDT